MVTSVSSLAKDIIRIDQPDWQKVATFMRSYIVGDMDKGKLQGPQKKYSNKGANVGWRVIKVNGKNRAIFIDSYKNKKARGFEPIRPKNLKGKALNRHTRSVNMKLTGETQRRIIPEGKEDGGYVIFGNAHIILSNEDKGYIIRNLNNRNKAKTAKKVCEIVQNNVNKYHQSKDLNIKIG